MANRLTRDQVLIRALDMCDSPTLDAKDRPNGTIVGTALSIGWLQDGLDFFHSRFPIGGTVKTSTITFVAGTETYTLPSDYILDYQDGVVLSNDQGRVIRKSLATLLNVSKASASTYGKPAWYAIVGLKLYVRPVPSSNWSNSTSDATLYYYGLPAVLAASDVPTFPSDLILVRYVYLRGLEWTRAVPPGTAEQYGIATLGDLQKQGIAVEQEADTIPFDRSTFPGNRPGSDPNSWMGNPIITGP